LTLKLLYSTMIHMRKIGVWFFMGIVAFYMGIFAFAYTTMPKEVYPDPIPNTDTQVESRKKIVIIDTGIRPSQTMNKFLCKGKDIHMDGTGTGLYDNHGHGTHVAHIIAKKLDHTKYCLVIIKWWHKFSWGFEKLNYNAEKSFLSGVRHAQKLNPAIVNMSLGGGAFGGELPVFQKMLDNGTLIVMSAGNDKDDLDKFCNYYPACYQIDHPNFIVVASAARTKKGIKYAKSSNRRGPAKHWQNRENVEVKLDDN